MKKYLVRFTESREYAYLEANGNWTAGTVMHYNDGPEFTIIQVGLEDAKSVHMRLVARQHFEQLEAITPKF